MLYDAPTIHYCNLVGVLGDDSDVVRDQHHRHLQLPAEAIQKLEDLTLDGHVQRGRWLVGNEQARAADQSDCNTNALP
nr:hypothetical protein [Devosia sp.]